ncbi:hypothetical protein phiPLPE_73 [Iodobacter phage PhiPLPE]|uniref:Uncharacterized protein n=1 Tax=Iodobacter phage PhiPLPE TaxID=551895 RepID=B5AX92_9CAUD|nr:hypothetical protein phiPLPE_73 [Iodobacter phage PhiPLPE]ACG60395.1 hypothetical protein phiPLPE_73 [Iodobacter phage PhiPLPE]
MNVQGLSKRAAGLLGYGVMMTSDYAPELSVYEREKLYREREKERLKKLNASKKGNVEIEQKAMKLLNAMPDNFTVFDLNKMNDDLKIFEYKNCAHIPRYFKSYVTTVVKRVKGSRVYLYTKVKK